MDLKCYSTYIHSPTSGISQCEREAGHKGMCTGGVYSWTTPITKKMPANELGLDYGPQPLTRREQFAMAAMRGVMAFSSEELWNTRAPSAVARWSIEFADSLIAELDKKQ